MSESSSPDRPAGFDPSATVDSTAVVGAGAIVGPDVVIGAHAVVGADVVLVGDVAIGAGAVIESDTLVCGNTNIGANATLGSGVLVAPSSRVPPGAVVPPYHVAAGAPALWMPRLTVLGAASVLQGLLGGRGVPSHYPPPTGPPPVPTRPRSGEPAGRNFSMPRYIDIVRGTVDPNEWPWAADDLTHRDDP